MNLSEMATEVYALTRRPDLSALTLSALKASTLKCHSAEFFFKDVAESAVNFATTSYFQTLDTKATFPLFRSIRYFRTYDTVAQTAGKFFTLVSPTAVLDSYGIDKTNIIYQAGAVINLRGDIEFNAGIIAFYQYPNTTDAGYDSWIADELPWAIIYDAASRVMKSVGQDAQATGVRALAQEYLQELIAANITEYGE